MATGVDYGIPPGLAHLVDNEHVSQTALDHIDAVFGDTGSGGGSAGGAQGGGGAVEIVGSQPADADPLLT
jgi:hypothetical protein